MRGSRDAVKAKSYGDPTTAFGGVPLVKTGASFTVNVTSSVADPPRLVAVTVNECEPTGTSPPVCRPALPDELRVRPDGSVPELTVNVGAGVPVAVNVKLYGVPTVDAGGAALVNVGGTTTWKWR